MLENVISLVGYENLCFMLYEDRELAADIFREVGERLFEYYVECLRYDGVGAVICNDDWGFNSQTIGDRSADHCDAGERPSGGIRARHGKQYSRIYTQRKLSGDDRRPFPCQAQKTGGARPAIGRFFTFSIQFAAKNYIFSCYAYIVINL